MGRLTITFDWHGRSKASSYYSLRFNHIFINARYKLNPTETPDLYRYLGAEFCGIHWSLQFIHEVHHWILCKLVNNKKCDEELVEKPWGRVFKAYFKKRIYKKLRKT